MNNPDWLTLFIKVYQNLNTNNLHTLEQTYHQDIEFQDPMHHLKGFNSLHVYFSHLYENLLSCHFDVSNTVVDNEQAVLFWTMTFEHPSLNKGKAITVEGNSLLKQRDGKVIYHRDQLDLGAMLYEHIPLLGRVIKTIKSRASQY